MQKAYCLDDAPKMAGKIKKRAKRSPAFLFNERTKVALIFHFMDLILMPNSASDKIKNLRVVLELPLGIQTEIPDLPAFPQAKKPKLGSGRKVDLAIKEVDSLKAVILIEAAIDSMKTAIFDNFYQLKTYSVTNNIDHVIGVATTYSRWVITAYSFCPNPGSGEKKDIYQLSKIIHMGEYKNENLEETTRVIRNVRAAIALSFKRNKKPLS